LMTGDFRKHLRYQDVSSSISLTWRLGGGSIYKDTAFSGFVSVKTPAVKRNSA
jgi:hypothetical protein